MRRKLLDSLQAINFFRVCLGLKRIEKKIFTLAFVIVGNLSHD